MITWWETIRKSFVQKTLMIFCLFLNLVSAKASALCGDSRGVGLEGQRLLPGDLENEEFS